MSQDETSKPKTKPFRLKRHHKDSSSHEHSSTKRRRRHEEERYHYRRHASDRPRHVDYSDQPAEPDCGDDSKLNADDAFRESLFDALADDEGAAYWEGVYGQSINGYADTYMSEQGELERMTEDEYVAFVRAKMWEKTHQGLLEDHI